MQVQTFAYITTCVYTNLFRPGIPYSWKFWRTENLANLANSIANAKIWIANVANNNTCVGVDNVAISASHCEDVRFEVIEAVIFLIQKYRWAKSWTHTQFVWWMRKWSQKLRNHNVVSVGRMYMLLHPCECNIQFTSTKLKGHRAEGVVLVNRILHEQGCNDKFISHWRHTLSNHACSLH